jgi:hypothetical protein
MPSNPRARITAIRKRLEKARSFMLQASADSIGESIPPLVEAATDLAALSQELEGELQGKLKPPGPGPEREKLLLEVRRLKADLSRLGALWAQGLEFCRKWSHAIQSAAGYLPNGESAPVGRSTTILVRG